MGSIEESISCGWEKQRQSKRWLGEGIHPPELGRLVEGRRFALCATAHLSDDEAITKMGHPAYGFRITPATLGK
jgi:hypothetical protein